MNAANKISQWSDVDIVNHVLSGDIDAYAHLVRRYDGYLYKIGRSYGFEHADVEDLMQETFVKAYTHLKGYEGRAQVKTWLVKIMLHECYHRAHKKSYVNEKAASENIEEEAKTLFHNRSENALKELQNEELGHIIENSVKAMDEKYRSVFTMREIMGLSTAETAEILHISESNVKTRLSRAKDLLRTIMRNNYSLTELFEFNLIYCDGMVERVMRHVHEG